MVYSFPGGKRGRSSHSTVRLLISLPLLSLCLRLAPDSPHYVVFPKDTHGFAIDDQYYIGSSGLLVKPVTNPGVESAEVYLAEDQVSVSKASRCQLVI